LPNLELTKLANNCGAHDHSHKQSREAGKSGAKRDVTEDAKRRKKRVQLLIKEPIKQSSSEKILLNPVLGRATVAGNGRLSCRRRPGGPKCDSPGRSPGKRSNTIECRRHDTSTSAIPPRLWFFNTHTQDFVLGFHMTCLRHLVGPESLRYFICALFRGVHSISLTRAPTSRRATPSAKRRRQP